MCTSKYLLYKPSFFLTKDSIGQSRAQVAADLLQELNTDVRGDFVEEVNFPSCSLLLRS